MGNPLQAAGTALGQRGQLIQVTPGQQLRRLASGLEHPGLKVLTNVFPLKPWQTDSMHRGSHALVSTQTQLIVQVTGAGQNGHRCKGTVSTAKGVQQRP
ncbi:hypothetical protein GCM10007071_28490 [Marinobacter zhanjiangensis]|uniref:Uncharacterized protein n=1 Tax=Marinobacter zhanjiangensis TaxID=578215 RepID=A0ABQ3B538_9GAMM|nr:hypothetical protein GCM10007071_28490 [Marinobacter zhanjiangensis]